MSIVFDKSSKEPSSKLGFSKNGLIRDAENRDDDSLVNALNDENAGLYLFSQGSVLVDGDAETLFSLADAKRFDPDLTGAVLLGYDRSAPRIAATVELDEAALPAAYQLMGLRELIFSSHVSASLMGAIAQGRSILYWNSVNQYCGKCGSKTQPKIGGYRRDCQWCGHKIFPRTDPAVIMLSTRGDRCLLARGPHFPANWYSTLAGFVEPGETLEDAVRRETFEESAIKIGRVKYFASQPWPFPHSVMIGVHCEALSDDITMDNSELEDCRWFSKSDVRLMQQNSHPEGLICPPAQAISSALITEWVNS